MNIRTCAAGLVVIGASLAAYWHFSPYLTLKAMRDAAQSKDADAFNERVDYPRVRESLKGQISALMAESMGQADSGVSVLGTMLGMAVVNPLVDALVRPETVMRSMQNGEFKPLQQPGRADGVAPDANGRKVEWLLERKSMNRLIAYAHEEGQSAPSKEFGLVFERQGFVDWKLTEIRLKLPK
jgi:hypothetical protein